MQVDIAGPAEKRWASSPGAFEAEHELSQTFQTTARAMAATMVRLFSLFYFMNCHLVCQPLDSILSPTAAASIAPARPRWCMH